MKSLTQVSMILALWCVAAGCSNLRGQRVAPNVDDQKCTAGVSYFLAKPRFTVVRKTLRSGSPAIPRYEVATTWEPDPERRFEVGMRPGIFASDTFELQLSADGTVAGLTSKRVDETGKALVGAANLAAAIAKNFAGSSIAGTAKLPAKANLAAPRHQAAARKPNAIPHECDDWCAEPGTDLDACAGIVRKQMGRSFDELATVPCGVSPPVRNHEIESGILRQMSCLDVIIAEARKPPTIAKALAKLNARLEKAIAESIVNGQPSPEIVQLKRQILEAMKLLDGRELQNRLRALRDVLQREPSLKDGKRYVALSAEFDRIAGAFDALNPSSPDRPSAEATDVTSQIDRDVYVDQLCQPLREPDKLDRVKLARARVAAGRAMAVVITAPVQ